MPQLSVWSTRHVQYWKAFFFCPKWRSDEFRRCSCLIPCSWSRIFHFSWPLFPRVQLERSHENKMCIKNSLNTSRQVMKASPWMARALVRSLIKSSGFVESWLLPMVLLLSELPFEPQALLFLHVTSPVHVMFSDPGVQNASILGTHMLSFWMVEAEKVEPVML